MCTETTIRAIFVPAITGRKTRVRRTEDGDRRHRRVVARALPATGAITRLLHCARSRPRSLRKSATR